MTASRTRRQTKAPEKQSKKETLIIRAYYSCLVLLWITIMSNKSKLNRKFLYNKAKRKKNIESIKSNYLDKWWFILFSILNMFRQTYQSGLLSILSSQGSKPFETWICKVSNGYIKRITDEDTNSLVLELISNNVR